MSVVNDSATVTRPSSAMAAGFDSGFELHRAGDEALETTVDQALIRGLARIISLSALALAVLASAALAEELTDAPMDQITGGGGLFELTADQLDRTTSAPVGPLQHNVIGGVGMLLENFLSEVFSSQQPLLKDIASPAASANTAPSNSKLGIGTGLSSQAGSQLGTGTGLSSQAGSQLGTGTGLSSQAGSQLGIGTGLSSQAGSQLGTGT